jgi:hypothetical protein
MFHKAYIFYPIIRYIAENWVIHAQMKLLNADLEHHNNESLAQNCSKEKISISPILQGKECEKTVLEIVSPSSMDTIENNNNTERERNFTPKIYGEQTKDNSNVSIEKNEEPISLDKSVVGKRLELTVEEEAILDVSVCPTLSRNINLADLTLKNKKCLDCGIIDAANPYRVWCPRGKGERLRTDTCMLEESESNG